MLKKTGFVKAMDVVLKVRKIFQKNPFAGTDIL